MSMRMAPPGRRSVITKDLCTYTTRILRQEKSLRDHGAGTTAAPAVSGGVLEVEQALGRIDDEDAGGDVHLGDDRLDERDQDLLGSNAGRPGRADRPDRVDGEDVLAMVEHVGDGSHDGAVHRAHA